MGGSRFVDDFKNRGYDNQVDKEIENILYDHLVKGLPPLQGEGRGGVLLRAKSYYHAYWYESA
jgi:hypothetical protein